jgi:predicted RNA-binding Zn-ribbon protein involved in translation (DUF1610 family)
VRIVLVTLALAALAGCGTQRKSASQAASTPPGPAAGGAGTQTVVASAPKVIEELTNQKQVFECPKCGMDFDAAGQCTMDGTELVAMRVEYSCPADGKPVDGAGRCPRCAMNARVEKTALAVVPAKDKP